MKIKCLIGYVDSIGEWHDGYLLEHNVEEPTPWAINGPHVRRAISGPQRLRSARARVGAAGIV